MDSVITKKNHVKYADLPLADLVSDAAPSPEAEIDEAFSMIEEKIGKADYISAIRLLAAIRPVYQPMAEKYEALETRIDNSLQKIIESRRLLSVVESYLIDSREISKSNIKNSLEPLKYAGSTLSFVETSLTEAGVRIPEYLLQASKTAGAALQITETALSDRRKDHHQKIPVIRITYNGILEGYRNLLCR
jgi:hypothetical protein